jgi:hypothetical protein
MSKLYIDKWIIPDKYNNRDIKPTLKMLHNLQVSDIVKLSNGGENFWVEILKIKNNAVFGAVRTFLYKKKKYTYGDTILFGKHQICSFLSETN